MQLSEIPQLEPLLDELRAVNAPEGDWCEGAQEDAEGDKSVLWVVEHNGEVGAYYFAPFSDRFEKLGAWPEEFTDDITDGHPPEGYSVTAYTHLAAR